MNSPTRWTRRDHLRALESSGVLDVLVIGGGVTGAGAALDLATRGLAVALVEQADIAHGTSSRSTKLFHGGIRYLPQFHFSLVSEGLREQKILARVADFLFEPLEFVIPLFDQFGLADAPRWAARGWRAPLALRAGLTLYDLLGGSGRPGARHRHVDPAELRRLVPTIRHDGLRGGFVYSDAQTDDARLVLTLAKTAVRRHDAIAVTRARVDRLDHANGLYTATVSDVTGDRTFEVRARTVLAATGAFSPPGLDDRVPPLQMILSKGVHLLFDQEALGLGKRAIVLPETDDDRVLFIVPWLGSAMVGTTDTAYVGDPAHPRATEEDIDYLLRHVRRYLEVPDVEPVSAFAGLRALADTGDRSTAEASRAHVIDEPLPGYVRVAGGKLTTYRRIAAEAADLLAASLGNDRRSMSAEEVLVGAGERPESVAAGLVRNGIEQAVAASLARRYGRCAAEVVSVAREKPTLAHTLSDGSTVLAEVAYAARHEGATTLADVTLRRTHLAWFTSDHARSDAAAIGEVMGAELGWGPASMGRHLAEHEEELAAEGL